MKGWEIRFFVVAFLALALLLGLMAASGEELQEDWSAPVVELISAEEQNGEHDLIPARASCIENCTVTFYCCERRPHICGTGDGITATGTEVTPGRTVAVDPAFIPLGSTVAVDYGNGELHCYIAEDTGGAVNGGHIDVAVPTHNEALQMGIKTATVWWW